MAITNKDIFEGFCDFVRSGATNEEIMKEYGGTPIPIPSYKLHGRDDEIRKRFVKDNTSPLDLAREYDLSLAQIYRILKPVREPGLDI